MIGNVARVNSGSEAVSVAGLDSGGSEIAWGDSTVSDMSPDGRYLTFQSTALNLVPGMATEGVLNVYLRDRTDGTIRLASGSRTGTSGGNGHSSGARVSADGRYVVFESDASDLVWGDENGTGDVFLWDSIEERTVLISVNHGGANSGNGTSWVARADSGRVSDRLCERGERPGPG